MHLMLIIIKLISMRNLTKWTDFDWLKPHSSLRRVSYYVQLMKQWTETLKSSGWDGKQASQALWIYQSNSLSSNYIMATDSPTCALIKRNLWLSTWWLYLLHSWSQERWNPHKYQAVWEAESAILLPIFQSHQGWDWCWGSSSCPSRIYCTCPRSSAHTGCSKNLQAGSLWGNTGRRGKRRGRLVSFSEAPCKLAASFDQKAELWPGSPLHTVSVLGSGDLSLPLQL